MVRARGRKRVRVRALETRRHASDGRGRAEEPGKALAYYRRAVAAGKILAYGDIIELHLSGEVADLDFAPIHEDLRARAGNGDAKSAYVLGRLHVNGVGVEKDPRRARAWWEASARLGYDKAAMALAGLAMIGELREGDWRGETLKWWMIFFGSNRGEWSARALSNRYQFAPYDEEEIRAARQAAEAFLDANPAFPRRDAPPD
jgi:TPR repeat protein